APPSRTTSSRRPAGTIGAGVEFLFFNNWSVFAEYNYLSFGNSQTSLISPATGVPVNFNHNVQTLLIGLNYRFSGPLSVIGTTRFLPRCPCMRAPPRIPFANRRQIGTIAPPV